MLHSQPRSIPSNAPSGEDTLPAPGRLLARNLRRRAVAPLEVGRFLELRLTQDWVGPSG